jgi:hypothetical protein
MDLMSQIIAALLVAEARSTKTKVNITMTCSIQGLVVSGVYYLRDSLVRPITSKALVSWKHLETSPKLIGESVDSIINNLVERGKA